MALRLPRFRRFSTQLLVLLAGLFAAVLLTVYLLVARANERNAREHIEQNLEVGARIFRRSIADRVAYLAGSAKVMSGDYAIRPLLMQDEPDAATLRTVLLSYEQRMKNAPLITLYSPEGQLIALTDETLGRENCRPFRHLIERATAGDMEEASDFAYLGERLHVLVVVPLYAPYPNIAGWFGLAYPIDSGFARALKDTTRLDVTFSSSPHQPPLRVLATTLAPSLAEAVARHQAGAPGAPEEVALGRDKYVTLFQPLPLLGDEPARIALQRSLTQEMAPALELQRTVLQISLTALFAAMLVAIAIARGVSRPVQQLAQHTKLVAAGDYSQRLSLAREDELGQLADAFNQMTAGLAERDRVRNLLGKVVSPEIATQLLASELKLGGEEREVTILFSDLRDFTSLSEQLPPTEVLALLNRYLDRMSGIIERHGGVIDKYIGDAIMALFGAPVPLTDAPARAVAAAREMAQALDALNRELAAEGKPTLAFGIGINTAHVVAGNMGSKNRLNYTVIGDGVNLASRLESLTKNPAYATSIIVSEATLAGITPRPAARELGEVTVKGKREAVRIYALSARGETAPPYEV